MHFARHDDGIVAVLDDYLVSVDDDFRFRIIFECSVIDHVGYYSPKNRPADRKQAAELLSDTTYSSAVAARPGCLDKYFDFRTGIDCRVDGVSGVGKPTNGLRKSVGVDAL